MDEKEFYGKWICPAKYSEIKPKNVFHRQKDSIEVQNELQENLHILYRSHFEYDGADRAAIRISADDYYKLYINGSFVSQGPAPGFNFNYYYNGIDITDFLKKGKNTLAVHTYYQGLINRVWVSGDDRCGLIFDVECNGKILAKSDETVKCRIHSGFSSLGKYGYDTQFGECYNSNAEEVGFSQVDFDDSHWEYARKRKTADYTLILQPTPQLVFEKLAPITVKTEKDGIFLDFGSAYVGYFKMCAKGNKNDKITLLFGQELNDDGSVRYELRANCTYREEWILSGRDDVLNEFDYKSFRYVKVVANKDIKMSDFEMIIRHYPFELVKKCKYPELSDVWELCINSLKYGVQEGIFDCMEREKGQYLGDGSFTSLTFAILTGDTRIMEKLIADAFRTTVSNDGLATCSPCAFMQEIAEYVLMLPHLIAAHYLLTKNMDYLRKYYEKWLNVLNFYKKSYEREDGFLYNLDKWCVVDWPQNARDGYDFDLTEGKVAEGTHNVINAYYYGAVKMTNRLAKLLGKPKYADDAKMAESFVNTFFDKDKKLFKDSPVSKHISLPSNAFALLFDLCPDKKTEDNIIKMILEKPAENAAFFVTFACLASMVRLNREDVLVKLLSDSGRWRRMLKEGATVTFEAWGKDVKWNTSLYHLCYCYAAMFMTDWGMEKIFEL